MELTVLDKNLNPVGLVDIFDSLIWTDRYSEYGDFEIYTSVTSEAISMFQKDYFLWNKDSEHVMIIEEFDIKTDVENGNKLIVRGRSLESILDRRIIYNYTILNGTLENSIKKLLDENAIVLDPLNPKRVISRLVFELSSDPYILGLTVTGQYRGSSLYDAIKSICDSNNLGFKLTLSNDNKFVFKLYYGVNRSYDQSTNPYVVFSPKFENLLNSHYYENNKLLKTHSIVGGEGEGVDKLMIEATLGDNSETELDRREIFVDASDVSATSTDGTLTIDDYYAQLKQRGWEELVKNSFVRTFEGQVQPTQTFVYGTDFFMGDIVQIINEYAMEAKSRVTELIHSQSSSGFEIYPTFVPVL
jgi:hypothetical protein